MEKLLVIDDDADMRGMLHRYFELRDYNVATAASGKDGLRTAYETRPDLVLLDIMMPDMDGWEVCRQLRDLSNVPIIMLTACARKDEVVRGLKGGADDYVTKPFAMSELEARIKATLRRCNGNDAPENGVRKDVFTDGHLTIDFERRLATLRGERIDLSPTEFKLLSTLVRHKDRVLPHRYLLSSVWGSEYTDNTDYVKLYVRYLRKKIEDDPSDPQYIQTEWGVGYRFTAA
jgi:DNA-binding response OmpR family regulator